MYWFAEHPIHLMWILPLVDIVLATISMLIIVMLPFGKHRRDYGKEINDEAVKKDNEEKEDR